MNKLQVPHYTLTDKLTKEQLEFFDKYGMIIFKNFIPKETVELFIKETQRIEREWLEAGYDKMNGIPLKFGKDENGDAIRSPESEVAAANTANILQNYSNFSLGSTVNITNNWTVDFDYTFSNQSGGR